MKLLLSTAAVDWLHHGGPVDQLEVVCCQQCGRLVHLAPGETGNICETCQAATAEKHECVH